MCWSWFYREKLRKGAFIENQMLALYKWLLMLQYQLDQLDMGFFFSTTLGKKYTGHHPWCIHVYSLIIK